MTKTIGIFIFDEVEVLDMAGPFEVFSVASRVSQRQSGTMPFSVITIAQTPESITARGGFRVVPEANLHNHLALDILIVPGGVVDKIQNDSEVLSWIKKQDEQVELIASVCTGAFVLAQAGLLDGLKVTTHWEDQSALKEQFPNVQVIEQVSWIDEGKYVTSGGISAGIDMSLHLIERLHSRKLALATAKQMEYRWQEKPK